MCAKRVEVQQHDTIQTSDPASPDTSLERTPAQTVGTVVYTAVNDRWIN